jgi:hypothetical protein
MANKLDEMIAPDEQVVYRSGGVLREFAWFPITFIVIVILTLTFQDWFGEVDTEDDNFRLYVMGGFVLLWVVSLGFSYAAIRATKAVVTDRRVLYKTGILKPKLLEMVLADIEKVSFVGWRSFNHGKIELRTGKDVSFHLAQGTAGLYRAIEARLGRSQPPEPARKVMLWAHFLGLMSWWLPLFFVFVIGINPIVGTVADTIGNILNWLELEEVFILVLVEVQALAAVFGVVFLIVMLAGGGLALCLARLFLSADEARQLVCLDYDILSEDYWQIRLVRRFKRLSARFLSWLYRQPIRCDDGEHGTAGRTD